MTTLDMFTERPAVNVPAPRPAPSPKADNKLHLTGPVYGNSNLEHFKKLFKQTYGRFPKGAELMAWATKYKDEWKSAHEEKQRKGLRDP